MRERAGSLLPQSESRQHQEAILREIERLGGTHQIERDARGSQFLAVTCQGTDAELEQLRGLDKLRWLDVSRTNITDEGLAKIRDLKQLQALKLQQTRVTDAGLANLSGLTAHRGPDAARHEDFGRGTGSSAAASELEDSQPVVD